MSPKHISSDNFILFFTNIVLLFWHSHKLRPFGLAQIENSNDCFCGAQMGILSMQASLIEEIVDLLKCRHNQSSKGSQVTMAATRTALCSVGQCSTTGHFFHYYYCRFNWWRKQVAMSTWKSSDNKRGNNKYAHSDTDLVGQLSRQKH